MIDREFNQFNMPEKMPEQNGDEKDAEESQEKNGLESLEKIRNELESLAQDYHLIAHQTMHDSAEKIIADDYFSDTGLQGTSLLLSVDSIMEVLPELDKRPEERHFGSTHKRADAVVIIAFPKEELEEYFKEKGYPLEKVRLDKIDDVLIDLYQEGRISQYGMPNRFVCGYYHKGKFSKNIKYNPSLEKV